ncbi:MAG: dihydrofolate reductase family protein [Micrococcales bacterium]|nr:dihydrofolate reductase family protein [Micrococcales bacterium]
MHQVIVCEFVTVDGVMEDPDGSGGTPWGGWAFRYGPGPVSGDKFGLGTVLDTGVQLLGRRTWELFAGLFPTRDDEFSTRMNRMAKVVVSRGEPDLDRWSNSTSAQGDAVDIVRDRVATQDVVVLGSGGVVDRLLAAGVVDELRLMVFPTVVGRGRRLFGEAALDLDLVATRDAGAGVLLHTYQRKGA